MMCAAEKVDLIANALEGAVRNKNILVLLQKLRKASESLGQGQKSENFHNMLRCFNRMWGDEFSPENEVVSPLLNDLFNMHGIPEERSKVK